MTTINPSITSKLPLKLQVAVRDLWEKSGTAVQAARARVADVLGLPVRCDPEWPQLMAFFDAATPHPLYADDRAQLVAVVAGCVEVWCRVFAELVEGADADDVDAAQAVWAEAAIERLLPQGHLRLFVEVAAEGEGGQKTKATTAWVESRTAFVLRLPSHAPVVVPSDDASAYWDGLLHCFDNKAPPPSLAHRSAAAAAAAAPADDWADVAVDGATGTVAVVEVQPPATATSSSPSASTPALPPTLLPSVASLPRPEDLLRHPPYHLRVSDYGAQKILVDGSHSPSLRLLGGYLERWCQTNHGDSRACPAVTITYRSSCWATSAQMTDQVALSTEDNRVFTIGPPIVLAFVEGVLGYTLVRSDGVTWNYRRTEPFKE